MLFSLLTFPVVIYPLVSGLCHRWNLFCDFCHGFIRFEVQTMPTLTPLITEGGVIGQHIKLVPIVLKLIYLIIGSKTMAASI